MKKLTLIIFLSIFIVIFSGCTQKTTETKTPVNSQTQQTSKKQTGEWVDFISSLNDYALQHPKDWIAGSLGKLYVTINSPKNEQKKINKKEGEQYMDDITIAYYESGDNFAGYPTYIDWLKDTSNPNSYISNVNQITFAGNDAWEMIMTGSRTGYVIMVENNKHLYQIGFNNRQSKSELTDIDIKIINSFKFINQ
ncbi:hypothetical protein A2531_03165 [Candidatus Falkowbacteria bacterium RIFOXYD2_FULL_34_120]|uniref:DUF4367 domain-containing protein n=1 Tax=Candidatus Falkowbacteria bacterium RIFOXYD2_FULL_34_120 TaxID=1798007 RepID=A0A1F5TQ77_9BACT|nr:MAG: hypothetical protein A2515_03035 [Candidatus Falkowbacteria bacterium RIFOXYD12_FULL_34_57]OGF40998.1 MAG: hypothetical protein A2531_03165 [Candidatus Falkowbacteria bacterium RIFOXYD2_FULL_34_120]